MSQHKIIADIHDLSGYGRCSLSVILPVISAMGIQVCPVPTAVMSTHTGGFTDIAMEDLTDHISACYNHYEKLHLKFDAIYSGFLSSPKQVDCCLEFLHGNPDSLKVVDPVMGDNGKPYSTYTPELIRRMKELVDAADVITPNLTETCMLLGEECPPVMSVAQARSWLARLSDKPGIVVIKGVPLIDDDGQKLSNVGFDRESGSFWRIDWDHIPVHYPGTGDIFTSVLTASLLKGESLPIALNRATTFTEIAVKTTYSYGTEPRLGVLFEDCLSWLMTNTVLCDYRKL